MSEPTWALGSDGIYHHGRLCSMMFLVQELNRLEKERDAVIGQSAICSGILELCMRNTKLTDWLRPLVYIWLLPEDTVPLMSEVDAADAAAEAASEWLEGK